MRSFIFSLLTLAALWGVGVIGPAEGPTEEALRLRAQAFADSM